MSPPPTQAQPAAPPSARAAASPQGPAPSPGCFRGRRPENKPFHVAIVLIVLVVFLAVIGTVITYLVQRFRSHRKV